LPDTLRQPTSSNHDKAASSTASSRKPLTTWMIYWRVWALRRPF
jgi:hypothetical protein